ncbi:nicotinate-nucleotide--dimethylbenzimidazole phosphoribosyltransferase [Acetivibrio cellulolyticus]|uniref:nicotinate-nucleotide--dimethylbenzimidazole phosphoribosyltransferase n=1 Tax=Acetivibrio cellulolyticus TaxID=35830 RepID=UPI0001E2FB9E
MEKVLESIGKLDEKFMAEAQVRLDSLTKPIGSLGKLEEVVRRIVGITGKLYPKVDKKTVIIMCADNGVVEEGVSSCPKSVTSSVTRNFTKGITAVNVLSKCANADIAVVDIGVDDDINCDGIINRKIRKGTWNIAKGPAMERDEAIKAIEAGIDIVRCLCEKGVNLLGTGEMGVGNTTTSSAVSSVLTGIDVEVMVGRGAGLTSEGMTNKIEVIRKAIEINKPDPKDPIDVLAKLGGLDIAGLVGCFIGAARYRIPILIDGFISATAALCAVAIKPEVRNYMFPSHGSAEPGSRKVLEALGMEPFLNLDMRVGEGTGAAIAFQLIDCAFAAYTQMGTFGDAKIEQYVPLS